MAMDDAEDNGWLCWRCTGSTNHDDEFAVKIKAADELMKSLMPLEVNKVTGSFQEGELAFHYPEISVRVAINLNQRFPVQCRIDNNELSRKVVDEIRLAIRIYLSEEALKPHGRELLDICLEVLRLVEEATSHLLVHRQTNSDPEARDLNGRYANVENELFGDEPTNLPDWLHDSPVHLLGISTKQICERVAPPEGRLRVLHCEKVMRSDLRETFYNKQKEMRENLSKQSLSHLNQVVPKGYSHGANKDELVEYLVKPRLTFHGTRKDTVSSIVRHGFLKPGDKHPKTDEEIGIRCGNTYGRGIYSSPDPSFAIGYSEFDAHPTRATEIPGFKLIVCATLMGRAASIFRLDNWRSQDKPYSGADSHVGNNELEYIVFSAAQILPCYVIHLDWGETPGHTLEEIQYRALNRKKAPRVPEMLLAPGDRQRLKEERLAQARKFFAYGFGPVEGNRIVIEDIADNSDDEEDYGEYQEERVGAYKGEDQSIWNWKPRGHFVRKDQYASDRMGS